MKNINKEIVEVFLETSFKECVLFCTDEKIINPEREKQIMLQYNFNEDLHHEIVSNFFDEIGINDEEFEKYSLEFEGDYNSKL